ncbi:hypothetical protein HYC85_022503 [Camellia sinensis]|uniref:Protein kinase domain-containing protein n=1 Tax=Camellia sinensis TaxID=4442 RepID=A0A7J7GPG6_CAMSI|nr:hypothetical protein HYC85_022503 [Camellia sinensis]
MAAMEKGRKKKSASEELVVRKRRKKIFRETETQEDDYWRKSKLPHATLFKPQHPYESSLWETFKDLPKTAVNLIETLLSVEPYKRGTASSALASEYFKTKPYACDPLTLPKYPPNKEIDAKHREEAQSGTWKNLAAKHVPNPL